MCPYCHQDPGLRGVPTLVIFSECPHCHRMLMVVEDPVYIVPGKTKEEREKEQRETKIRKSGLQLVKGGKN